MKKVLQQPFILAAGGCFIAAILIAVLSTVLNPRIRLVDKMEKNVNKGNVEGLAACFVPEDQEDIEMAFSMGGALRYFNEEGSNSKLNILTGSSKELEDGTNEVSVFVLTNEGKTVVDVESSVLKIVEVDGKQYLAQ